MLGWGLKEAKEPKKTYALRTSRTLWPGSSPQVGGVTWMPHNRTSRQTPPLHPNLWVGAQRPVRDVGAICKPGKPPSGPGGLAATCRRSAGRRRCPPAGHQMQSRAGDRQRGGVATGRAVGGVARAKESANVNKQII